MYRYIVGRGGTVHVHKCMQYMYLTDVTEDSDYISFQLSDLLLHIHNDVLGFICMHG